MPKRKTFREWNKEDLHSALRRVEWGELSLRAASRQYSIPLATLADKFHGRTPVDSRQGPSTYLTPGEEKAIVDWAIQMTKVGLGQTKENIKDVVKNMIDKDGRKTPFTNNRPGDKWFGRFLTRNPRLVFRKSQPIGKERAIVTPGRIDRWFKELEAYLEEVGAMSILFEGRRMFNCDESGFPLGGRKGTRVLAEKGSKVVHEVRNSDKTQITVLATMNAVGDFLPPVIIVPGKRTEACGRYMTDAPHGAFFAATDSGWMDSKSFFAFVANLFHPFLTQHNIPRPVLLMVDGHSTHQSPEVASFCRENGIILYRLPPNATHLLQPCDVSLFRSLKAEWNNAERAFRITHPGYFVTKSTFAGVFKKAWERVASRPAIAINGFKAAGIFPFTKNYKKDHLHPSSIFSAASGSTSSTSAPEEVDQPSTSRKATDVIPQHSTPRLSSMDRVNVCDRQAFSEADFVSPALHEYIRFPRVEFSTGKRRQQLPEAISGEAFLEFLQEKEDNKKKEEERKRERLEERQKAKKIKEEQLRGDEKGEFVRGVVENDNYKMW
nr:uncharacterized protein LOC129279702 [Lytechinus pictus]